MLSLGFLFLSDASQDLTYPHPHRDTQIHTDTQIYRYTDTQIHRCTDTQIDRYKDTQIHRWTDTQIHRYTDALIHRYADTHSTPATLPPRRALWVSSAFDLYFAVSGGLLRGVGPRTRFAPKVVISFGREHDFWNAISIVFKVVLKKKNCDM